MNGKVANFFASSALFGIVACSASPPSSGSPTRDARSSRGVPTNEAFQATSTTSVTPPAPSEPSASPSKEQAPPSVASAIPASENDSAPAPLPVREEVRFAAHYPESASVSLLAFEKERGLRGPRYDQRCWSLEKVGTPPTSGLLCLTKNAHPEFTLANLYRIEDKTLRLVWQETIFTYANWLELTPILAEDGASLELMDRRPHSCEMALSEYRAKVSARVAPPSGELLEPACRKRGKYVYERGRFRHFPNVATPGPLPYF